MKTDSIKYFVNKDKGIVVAKMTINGYDLATEMNNAIRKNGFVAHNHEAAKFANHRMMTLVPIEMFCKSNEAWTFYGKAKCAEEDEFNEEFGKALARKRLMKEVYNYKMEAMKTIRNVFYSFIDATNCIAQTYCNKVDSYADDEDELLYNLRRYALAKENLTLSTTM